MPTATPFNNLITFSRGSNATVTGSNGLIQWAPNNLLLNSEQFDNAAWSKLNAGTGVIPVVTANAGVAPDGTTTADRVQLDRGAGTTASDVSRLFQSVALLPTNVGTLSVWLRSFDGVSTYTVGLTNGSASSTVTVTGVWQRFSLASISSTANAQIRLQGDITQQTADLLIWGAQLELGSTATTYNPTTVKNLLGFSEAFDNAAWTKTNSSIVTGAQANPINGLFNAQKLMEDTVAAVPHGFASANVTTIVGTPMTSAFYAKAAGRSWVVANAFNAANKRCWFDLANGTAGTTAAGCTTSITSVGNGWYRCAVIQTAAATTMSLGLYASTADGVLSYTGDGNSGVYIYGAQLSDSASLDPYVPTPGAAPSSTAFYGPRFDFDPVTLQPRGLLVEEQRTNLVTYSEQFDNAAWIKTNTAVSANATTSPDGTTNAEKLTSNAGAGGYIIGQNASVTSGVTYTASAYIKAAEVGFAFLLLSNSAFTTAGISINLSSGAVSTALGTPLNATATNAGNGWWRVSFNLAATATTTGTLSVYLSGDGLWANRNNAITVGNGIFAFGAQLEAGAFATSYIPTVASTVTRSADVATISGSLFSQWYSQTAGSFVVDADGFNKPGQYSNTFFTENIQAGIGNANWRAYNGTTNGLLAGFGSAVDGVPAKTAIAYQTGASQSAGSLNGAAVATFTNPDLIATAFRIGGPPVAGGTPNYLNGHIRNIRFIPARAADFQLQGLST